MRAPYALIGSEIIKCKQIQTNSRQLCLESLDLRIAKVSFWTVEIKCEDSVKLLGVTIDYLLNFDLHVSNICKMAARQINVLLRLSKFLRIETKILIYKSFIRSSFNFCPLVWHFCSKTSSAKMEKLQYRALRLVFNDFDSSYETLLERVNMPTLHISRIRYLLSKLLRFSIKCHLSFCRTYYHTKILFTPSDMTTL